MYSIAINQDYNSTEVTFDGKPSYEIRSALVGLGFRWHKVKGIWYGRKSPAEVEKALAGEKTVQESPKGSLTAKSPAEERKARKERVKAYVDMLMQDVWKRSPSMRDYYEKELFDVVTLSDGSMIEVENHDIETRFCFGSGYNGVSTAEDDDNAERLAAAARTNEEFFRNENIKPVDDYIEYIKSDKDFRLVNKYIVQGSEKFKDVTRYDPFGSYVHSDEKVANAPKLTEEDKALFVQALQAERENFAKRIETYLKRYGLSKIVSWTYLSD